MGKILYICEKLYELVKVPDDQAASIAEAKKVYEEAINELITEENLAYEYLNGIFQRRGRPQTQKSLKRVSAVLADERYSQARNHYNKAVKFFNERPNPDVHNSIKEAICALEAFVEIIFKKKASKNFEEAIRSQQGNKNKQIHSTIGESIIKLRAFRGNAQGVAHASLDGGYVSITEAELALSLVATYITYLYDKFAVKEEELPF
ncbi:MAG: hypothetical protein Fur0022_23150 [Anaerolineales bacterium]